MKNMRTTLWLPKCSIVKGPWYLFIHIGYLTSAHTDIPRR